MDTLELGRTGSTHVANFKEPLRIPEDQRFQTVAMFGDPSTIGVEFIRSWDSFAVSMISLAPFGMSIVFAAVWMAVFIAKGNDPQIVVQAAFAVAAYIVTAGKSTNTIFDQQSADDKP